MKSLFIPDDPDLENLNLEDVVKILKDLKVNPQSNKN